MDLGNPKVPLSIQMERGMAILGIGSTQSSGHNSAARSRDTDDWGEATGNSLFIRGFEMER